MCVLYFIVMAADVTRPLHRLDKHFIIAATIANNNNVEHGERGVEGGDCARNDVEGSAATPGVSARVAALRSGHSDSGCGECHVVESLASAGRRRRCSPLDASGALVGAARERHLRRARCVRPLLPDAAPQPVPQVPTLRVLWKSQTVSINIGGRRRLVTVSIVETSVGGKCIKSSR